MNYLAIVVAALAAFAIGFLWHGPLFGNLWMKLSKVSKPDAMTPEMKKHMQMSMFWSFIMQLVTAAVLAQFAALMGTMGVMGAVILAFWAWLGFIVTTAINGVLWENKSWNLYYFTIAYHLVSLIVVSLIVVLWK